MPPISVLIKPASGHCNMSCEYCFYRDEMEKREQSLYGMMTEETLKNVIRRTLLKADYAATYTFQGGEPTLRGLPFFEKVIELQKQYNKKGIQITNTIQTNGYQLDDKWCDFLQKNHFLVGISVDGTKEVHNALRHGMDGGDTYDRVCQAIKRMDQFQVEYNILTVVTKSVAEKIDIIYKEYSRNNWHYQQYIACLDPIGEERGHKEYALLPVAYGQFLIRLFGLWYEDWKKGNAPYIRQFENYIGILKGYVPEACEMRGSCSIQNVVEADGSVYPCDFYATEHFCLGNFNKDQLEQIQEKAKESGFVKRSLRVDLECKECRYWALCRGGCMRNRISGENTDQYRNYYCESYRMFFGACLEQMREIANKKKE